MSFYPDSAVMDTVPDQIITDDSITNSAQKVNPAIISPTKAMMQDDIEYTADSIIMHGFNQVEMFGNSVVTYGEIKLASYYIWLNLDSNLIYSKGRIDSVGKLGETPEFTDKGVTYKQEELTYNYRTGKGFIKNVVTEQGEGYVTSEQTKRIDEEAFCMKNGKYTTCDHHDHPHFYINLTKAKVRPGKNIVTGPAYLVIEDVPIYPLFLPFGFFPFTKKYSSGFLMPSYGEENNRGFYLKDGGYYFAASDYFDLSATGDIYSKGSWALRGQSSYKLNYKFSGNVNMSYINNVTGIQELEGDYTKTKDFSVRWSHSQDSKASAYSNFSASVDFSSTSFEKNSVGVENLYNPSALSRNHKGSSVSYSRIFPGTPFSLNSAFMASQNAADSTLSLTLPQVNISMSRIYPFKRRKKVGQDRWYEKIGMSYSATLSNSVTDKQSAIFDPDQQVDWKYGMRHSIPVNTSFNILKNISISPSVNYTERWYPYRIEKEWIGDTVGYVKTDTTYGFNRVFDYSTSVSASTKLYGFYTPIRKIFGDRVDAIRHVMTPSVSFSYRPDFGTDNWDYYDTYQQYNERFDEWEERTYSYYDGSLYGTPGRGKSGSVGFSIGNNVEMKVRSRRDTTGKGYAKVKLIESLSLSTSYNIPSDSMNWSDISVRGRTTLFKGLSINFGASFDPYVTTTTANGRPVRINTLYWERDRKIGQMKNLTLSTGYGITNQTFSKLLASFSGKDESEGASGTGSETGGESDKSGYDKDGYVKFAMPWNASFSYSYTLAAVYNAKKDNFDYEGISNLRFNGGLKLTDQWDINFSSGYDFKRKEIASTNFSVRRSLHCWSMSFNAVPFGRYKTYNFTINVNSSMLQDLKYEKRSSPYDNPGW
jgi:lipopolysaccharide assembly outer membrane protein LptD (OstA)